MKQFPTYESSFKSLTIGFILSGLLIVASYFIVVKEIFTGDLLFISIMGLLSVQAVTQLICFFHIGMEEKPRWNLITLLFMLLIAIVVIGGSLWIMYNLNYHMGGVPH